MTNPKQPEPPTPKPIKPPEGVPATGFSVQVIVNVKEKKTFLMTNTNIINQMTVDILCEGIVWAITAMRNAGDTPGSTQKRLDRMKKHVWEGVINHADHKLVMESKDGKIDPTKT